MEKQSLISGGDKESSSTSKVACCIYVMYLAGVLMPMLPMIGVIFGYVFKKDAKANLKSHYQYIIRTFWVGFLYFIISGALIIIGIGVLLTLLCIVWWLIRIAKGLKYLMRGERIPSPKTWLF